MRVALAQLLGQRLRLRARLGQRRLVLLDRLRQLRLLRAQHLQAFTPAAHLCRKLARLRLQLLHALAERLRLLPLEGDGGAHPPEFLLLPASLGQDLVHLRLDVLDAFGGVALGLLLLDDARLRGPDLLFEARHLGGKLLHHRLARPAARSGRAPVRG